VNEWPKQWRSFLSLLAELENISTSLTHSWPLMGYYRALLRSLEVPFASVA
jgi:hypothetical protein